MTHLKNLPTVVQLICARKSTGPSPLRGTIVDNVDTGRSEKAFNSRVSTEISYLFTFRFIIVSSSGKQLVVY